MKATYALYTDPESAKHAIVALKATGVAQSDIVIMSPEPLEAYEFDPSEQKTSMRWVAVMGGGIGCVFGASLPSLTQLLWPLNTGGMPIVSIWPNLIITFEMTMLGAIVATVISLVRAAGLGRRLPEFYDPQVSDNKILVGIANPSDAQLPGVEQALRGGELKTIP